MKILLLAFLFFTCLPGYSQFKLSGAAQRMNADCIMLTPDEQYVRGLAFHTTKVDLSNQFEIEFDIYLGNKDEGADGIVFVMHNDPRGFNAYGTWGECMSYGRWSKFYVSGDFISPSIAIEFDTYENFRQNDPTSDHIAYLENGTNYHEVYWNSNNKNFNLEDDLMHNFRLNWNPKNHQLQVWLDRQKVYESNKDLVNEIFAGETQVIWGFTASTGRAHNLQYFCLRRWAKYTLPQVKPAEKEGD
ncbi:L-type lectin-domain containing protein [Rapidithrix thailandica]|uniref:L-type lectin-domain containing protein n=1 Tax=Rapidithrix thailandica TaxID=413964 RepID=A0AAW9S2A8_9BACT